MLTLSAKPAEVKHHWHLVDADGMALGRLASRVARVLQGKHRPDWTAHVDCGDFVVVINCSKIRLSGKKAEVKQYLRYTGYPGGLRAIPYKDQLAAHPDRVIQGGRPPHAPQEPPRQGHAHEAQDLPRRRPQPPGAAAPAADPFLVRTPKQEDSPWPTSSKRK